jgi:hypothetical protein
MSITGVDYSRIIEVAEKSKKFWNVIAARAATRFHLESSGCGRGTFAESD